MKLQLLKIAQRRCLCSAAAVLALGCASGSDTAEPQTGAMADAADADAASGTARCPADTPMFSAAPDSGLLVVGNRSTVQGRIIQAEPAQPERFENDWTVQFSDLAGVPLDNLAISSACAFMPVHGHGGEPKEVVKSGAGTFSLMGLNLFMRGPWEVQLAVRAGAMADVAQSEATNCDRERRQAGSDLVVFRACISDD